MGKSLPKNESLNECVFLLKKNEEDITARLICESGNKYGSPLHKESTFYDIMMKNSTEIKEDWAAVTLTINFEKREAVTTTFNHKKEIISTNKF